MRTENIYLISTKDSANQEYLKIGITSGNPLDRIKNLQTGCPLPLSLKRFYIVPTKHYDYRKGGSSCGRIEKLLHECLDAYHVSGEWFKMEDDAWKILNSALESIERYESKTPMDSTRQKIENFLNEAVSNAMV